MRLHVAGTGSFAAEVVEFAHAAGMQVEGLIELLDRSRVGTAIHGLPVIDAGSLPDFQPRAVLGLGGERGALWGRLRDHGWKAATVVHPRAAVSPSATVGAGCVIGPFVVVGAQSTIGEHGLLGRGALIGHHVELNDGVVVNPGANVGGNVHVGLGATIGMGATVVNGVTIGERALVAAGAVVIRDVPSAARVQGVPARIYSDRSSDP
jgi:sugar O-acyltransferase (sialic acid O-acetyltransferase NeuD family)